MDGRNIGTAICPDAQAKFFVDADVTVRATRRHNELLSKGETLSYDRVLEDMKIRDARDAGRADAPMVAAQDAILLDTTTLGPDEVFERALTIISQKITV